MSKTRLQLANRALDKLRIVGIGQSPEAEDTEKVNNVIDSFVEWLANDIYTIADVEEIDEAPFEWIADLLAWFCAPDFFKPRDLAAKALAEMELQKITATRPTYERMTAEYF